MNVRKAKDNDSTKIIKIYKIAQEFMIENGNSKQWGRKYPSQELIKEDIENGISYVITEDNEIHGVFVLLNRNEPTYEYIEKGQWLNDDEYLTIHRIASDGKVHGIFKCAIDYCKRISDNIRIDTHYDNIIMQKVIEKNGFIKCGRIYVRDNSPRIAYQWIR